MQPRPEAGYYQMPAIMSKTAEIAILSLLDRLVRKKVLTLDEALATLGDLALLDGVNNAHQVGMALKHWRETLQWRLEQKPEPKAA